MAYRTFTQKRPNDSRVFGFDLINQLGPNEFITGVTAVMTLKDGVVDGGMGSMISGLVYFLGTKVWTRVGAGLAGNYYFITFTVTTTSQSLELVGVIPVSTGV